jgi:hypothetical protein
LGFFSALNIQAFRCFAIVTTPSGGFLFFRSSFLAGSLTVKYRVFYRDENERRQPQAESSMKRPLPRTPAQWLKEIKLAIADAADAEPFGRAIGELITDAISFIWLRSCA